MIYNIILLLVLVGFGIWEFRRHQKNIDRVPIRLLINGTRGKSSVTRLITAGLQAGGVRTLGKSTGTKPCLIFPDGSERPISRPGKANIIEQLMVFRKAIALKVDAVVVECMAVLPQNQLMMERKMVRSTIGVITNARADHLDEMGPTLDDVARSLAGTMPEKGVLFTCEHERFPIFDSVAAKRNSRAICIQSDHISDAMMAPFTYIEHKDNVALALAVCNHLGIPEETALRGMYEAVPDPGVLRIYRIHYFDKEIEFVNAFAANDPDSYEIIWKLLARYFTDHKKIITIVNCREDRIQRTESLAEFIAKKIRSDYFILVGVFTAPLMNKALSMGLSHKKIINMGNASPLSVFEKIASITENESIVVGIGNIVLYGEELVMHFTNKGKEVAY